MMVLALMQRKQFPLHYGFHHHREGYVIVEKGASQDSSSQLLTDLEYHMRRLSENHEIQGAPHLEKENTIGSLLPTQTNEAAILYPIT